MKLRFVLLIVVHVSEALLSTLKVSRACVLFMDI